MKGVKEIKDMFGERAKQPFRQTYA